MKVDFVEFSEKENVKLYGGLEPGDVFEFMNTDCLALKLDFGHVLFEVGRVETEEVFYNSESPIFSEAKEKGRDVKYDNPVRVLGKLVKLIIANR